MIDFLKTFKKFDSSLGTFDEIFIYYLCFIIY